MEQNDLQGSPGPHGRPLGRGLENVSHLFLSGKAAEGSASDRAAVGASGVSASDGAVVALRSATLTRERLAAILAGAAGALEDGLRTIDTKVLCHPCGEIDVVALDRAGQLALIDFETTVHDGLLLRGIGHFDWVTRNIPIVERMYRSDAIDAALPVRLLLLAPQFSPLLRRVMRLVIRPQIHWVRYHTVDAPSGLGILFESVVGD